MRHGGDHSGWWCQERQKERTTTRNIAVQLQGFPEPDITQYSKVIAVYVQCNEKSLRAYGNEILKFIGGQTHVICKCHKYPLISICIYCDRKEHYRCPELGCNIYLCNKCFDRLPRDTVNMVDAPNDDDSSSSILKTPCASDNDERSVRSNSYNQSLDQLSNNSNESRINDYENNDYDRYFDEDSNEDNISDDDEKSDDDKKSDYLQTDRNKNDLDRDEFEDFVTYGAKDFDYESDDSYKEDNDGGPIGDFNITTDAGDLALKIEEDNDIKQTRGMNVSGHVILNFVGYLLTRKRHELKCSSITKYFLQRLVCTSLGKSVSLLYPEAMLFPCIFWYMFQKSLVGTIPATILSDKTTKHGFASIPQHIRSRVTSSSVQTSTNNRYTAWAYDMVINLATNNHDTRMVINKGLTASKNESEGLSLRGGNKDSALLDSIDSKQVIKNLMASQRYFPFDFF